MRVLEAVKRIRDGTLALPELWSIATRPERVTVALILGLPSELPKQAATPVSAWNAINRQQQRMVLSYAPDRIRARLPTTVRPPRRLIRRDGLVVAAKQLTARQLAARQLTG